MTMTMTMTLVTQLIPERNLMSILDMALLSIILTAAHSGHHPSDAGSMTRKAVAHVGDDLYYCSQSGANLHNKTYYISNRNVGTHVTAT